MIVSTTHESHLKKLNMGPEFPCCRIETFSGSGTLENQYNWSNEVCIRQQQFAVCLAGGFTMTHPDLTLHNVLKHPRHMASKSLCCSTLYLSNITYRTFVNSEPLYIPVLYIVAGEKSNIYRYMKILH